MTVNMIMTFDCYGTLIDWLSGAKKAFLNLYPDHKDKVDAFIKYWGEKDWELVKSGVYKPYREILAIGFKYALERIGLEYDEDVIVKLTYSIYDWEPFPDVKEALEALLERDVELGIISNTDRDFIMKSIENIGVEFKHVIVAEDIKLYKPDPRVFVKARELLPKTKWIHVSSYPQYDIIPAIEAGVDTILLDRYDLEDEVKELGVPVIKDINDLVKFT